MNCVCVGMYYLFIMFLMIVMCSVNCMLIRKWYSGLLRLGSVILWWFGNSYDVVLFCLI